MKKVVKIAAIVGGSGLLAGTFFLGTSSASIPDADGKVYACYDGKGNTRIIDKASENCLTGETQVTWPGSVSVSTYVKNVSTSAGSPNADCDSGDLLMTMAGTSSGTPIAWNVGSFRTNGSGHAIGVSFAATASVDLVCLNQ